MPLAEAVVDAGAIRFRPMMLTAMAVVVGGSVILFDPIFQGLAISLMAGEVASLLISRMAVPVIYFLWMRYDHKSGADEDVTPGGPPKRHRRAKTQPAGADGAQAAPSPG
jgi:hypothetical protein